MLPIWESNNIASRQTYPYLTSPLRDSKAGPILKDPESYATSIILATNIYARTIGDDEFVRVSGSDEVANKTWTKAIERTFHQPQHQHVMWKAFLDVSTFGLGWIENPVETIREMTLGPVRRDIGEGATTEDFTPQPFSRREPVWKNLNIFDVYPDWSAPLGAPMRGAGHIGRATAQEFKAWVEGMGGDASEILDSNTKDFHFGLKGAKGMGQRWRELAMRQLSEEDLESSPETRPVQWFMYRGEVPWKAVDDVERYRTIIVANDQLIMDEPHPYYKHPYRAVHMLPMTDRPFGMAPTEVARYEQDELDTWRMLRTKAGIRTVNTPIVVDPGMFNDVSQFEDMSSDQTILTRTGVGSNGDVKRGASQMDFNYASIFTASNLIQEERSVIRESTGIGEILRGISAGGRTTAREIGELSAAGNLPLSVRVDLIENEDLPAIARDVGQRFILALRGEPDYDKLLQDMLGLPGAKLEHLSRNLKIKFQGSRRFQAKGAQGGIIERVVNIMATVPGIANFLNMPLLAAELLKSVSPDAADRFMLNPEAAIGQSLTNKALAPDQSRGVPSPPRPSQQTIQ